MSGYHQSYQDYDDDLRGGSTDAYYQNVDNSHGNYQGGDGYYDESGYYNSHSNNPYRQDGGYYDAYNGDQDDHYHNVNDDPAGDWDGYDYRATDNAPGVFSDFTQGSRAASASDVGYDLRSDERHNDYKGTHSPQISISDDRFSGEPTSNYSRDYDGAFYEAPRPREPYPAWVSNAQIPLSKEEIEDVFLELTHKFGFQRDSMRNMYDHLMTLLDSRASRMTPNQAILCLHADYIGGDNANYRKWYFAAHMELDDPDWFKPNVAGVEPVKTGKRKNRTAGERGKGNLESDHTPLESLEYRWKSRMNTMSQRDRLRQVALYLLCWGEANQVRFMPECLCFIFKCAEDYLNSETAHESTTEAAEEFTFLNNVITPLYQYIRDQGYEILDGTYVRREKDHDQTVGYDDCNQLFWYREGIERIILSDTGKTRLIDVPPAERYLKLKDVMWKKCFMKTYRETRSWFHLLLNFNRVWVIHLSMFWFYISYNAPTLITPNYEQQLNNPPPNAALWSFAAFGGAIATLVNIFATLAEWAYIPRRWVGAESLTKRFVLLLVVFVLNTGPGVYIFMPASSTEAYLARQNQQSSLAIGIVHFFIAIATFLYFAVMPLGGLFQFRSYLEQGRYTASQTFTRSYPRLKGNDMVLSYGLWATVFGAKFLESWYYLALTLRDPLRNLNIMDVSSCLGDTILKTYLCKYQPVVAMVLMVLTDLVLFFLDTYLWYVLLSTGYSTCRSFTLGSSILTPWRNVFSRLPKRIYSKILSTSDMEVKYKPKVLISQVWNAIVISMYREHLLSIDHVQKLLYHQVPSEQENKRTLRAPTFFVSQEDQSTEYFPKNSEAERRISFFSQSLSTPVPEPVPVDNMPTFTVLIPHYSEKILLSLREIIREDEPYSRVTILEYLKQLHPHEWECFVKDTQVLAEETSQLDPDSQKKKEINDLPFYCIGFKSSAPEYALRTRIWASLRFQTLYRTLSGFMNYSRAIKLLYRVENPEIVQLFGTNGSDKLERELESMARRKFKLLVSMQRYAKFTKEEIENTEFLLRAYPDLQIAYLDEEPPIVDGEEPAIYSVLIDGHSELLENGMRRPKFRVRLSGNPILGDGKSDNQNHALIFYRGEYIQLIDANQDNYLEECLKIRSVLAEFEEMKVGHDFVSPYLPGGKSTAGSCPVAIVGAREYIFSENIGILGDLAAGKEQTFGTLFSRTLAQIGGKLHYGHPDFLNGVFMTTRGGVSKAQKGLHLNEDIYAGMNAMLRGGRIKHCEYYQCGKGRDLGFGSILNFTTKIGTGMGEQMLSREYFYLGTQLPLDRFLSFYYAHAGFHLNNIFIMLSLQLLMVTFVNIGALRHETIHCNYNPNVPTTDPLFPTGCQNTDSIMDWMYGRVLSIFIIFFINFIPLIVQETLERGLIRSTTRFVRQILSLSPLFEMFITQIYANSVQQDLSFGGARYIATGRGFATARIPFGVLYARFAGPSLYFGSRLLIMLLFATLTVWQPTLIYFWLSLSALIISPFLYNPHQFAWNDFFIDYREFIHWLSRGNSRSHASSWIAFCRFSRTRTTGYKRKIIGSPSSKLSIDVPRAPITNIFFGEIIVPLLLVATTLIPYLFINAQTGVNGPFNHNDTSAKPTASLLRVVIVAIAPIAVNASTIAVFFMMACVMGPMLSMCCKKFGSILAAIAHAIAVLMLLVSFEVMFFLEGFDFTKTVLGMITAVAIQRFILQLIISLALTREFKTDQSNTAFWTGKWYSMGWHSMSQPAREFLCKITEMSMFAGDFILCHIALFSMLPVILIPKIDLLHSILLFWLRPSRQIRPPIYSLKQTRLRRKRVLRYAILYFVLFVGFLASIVAPVLLGSKIPSSLSNSISSFQLVQPNTSNNNDTAGSTQTGTAIQASASIPPTSKMRLI